MILFNHPRLKQMGMFLGSFSLSQDINQLSREFGTIFWNWVLEMEMSSEGVSPRTDHLDGGSAQVYLRVK